LIQQPLELEPWNERLRHRSLFTDSHNTNDLISGTIIWFKAAIKVLVPKICFLSGSVLIAHWLRARFGANSLLWRRRRRRFQLFLVQSIYCWRNRSHPAPRPVQTVLESKFVALENSNEDQVTSRRRVSKYARSPWQREVVGECQETSFQAQQLTTSLPPPLRSSLTEGQQAIYPFTDQYLPKATRRNTS